MTKEYNPISWSYDFLGLLLISGCALKMVGFLVDWMLIFEVIVNALGHIPSCFHTHPSAE